MVLLLISFYPASSPGQDAGITRRHHPWGCFEVGAWRRVRVVTETFEENRALTSITETKTTLKAVEEDGVTLVVDMNLEVGGKQLQTESQTVKQAWHGELANQDVKVTHLGASSVVIQGRKIPCKIEQLELTGPASKTTTKIYYSDTVEPFILKRESVTTDLEGTNQLGEATVEVMDVDVPCRLLASIRNTFHVKAVRKDAKGTETTVAFTSTRVPGGVIRQTSNGFDVSGRLIRQSRLELLDYGLEPEEEWTGLWGRMRAGRLRKQRYGPSRFPPYRLHWSPLGND